MTRKAIAIVGIGSVMPDAPDTKAFWENIKNGRYSISDVTPDRWKPELYYDSDHKAPDKSYSKIGGWVRNYEWDPLKWRLPIPPRVSDAMDLTQKWAIVAAREALADFGYPNRPLDTERTAVIFGNAMGGDMHLYSASRIFFPEFAEQLAKSPHFADLPQQVRQQIIEEARLGIGKRFPIITEDTMPGELSNVVASRIAALYDFHGPNFVADAACASAMAAITAAVEGLAAHDFDAVVTGGIDANMSASTFVKFSKIGALSASGTRPYAKGADGFVMGEGAAVFILKRLEDAEAAGDKIYAVIRGLGGASDGKGKGITAPNPIGQRLAVERGWQNAGLSPSSVGMIEGHGTSTIVGDVVEVECLIAAFAKNGLAKNSVALGSVKSNIGHLKGAAGAVGILKTALALHHKVMPPSINFEIPNPNIDFANSPFYVNTQLKEWTLNGHEVRRAGVSAFGFGGTNFHTVMEEYVPGRIQSELKTRVAAGYNIPPNPPWKAGTDFVASKGGMTAKTPLRGALLIGGKDNREVAERLRNVLNDAKNGNAPKPQPPAESDLRAPVRLSVDYADAAELAKKGEKTLEALEKDNWDMWRVLRPKGVFLWSGAPPKVAFLFTGQGSQYVNMLNELRKVEPIVDETFREADAVMTPLLGKPLSEFIFVNGADKERVAQAEEDLRQTAITQPAVLATDIALCRLLAAYGIEPDMVMGHSLGEYGALVAAGALPFAEALKAVSARGKEMTKVSMADNGIMAAVFGPPEEVEKIIGKIDGYVVIANINSSGQAVIGGATEAVQEAIELVRAAGYTAQQLSVSHAFHTQIVAPASAPMARVLEQFDLRPPKLPIISNVTGEFYPMGPLVRPQMIDLLSRQIASPVQFVKGANSLYEAGARIFIEVGPKRALNGFIEDLFGNRKEVLTLSTNHPRLGDFASFNIALCGFYACGLGRSAKLQLGSEEGKTEVLDSGASAMPQYCEMGDTKNKTEVLHSKVEIGKAKALHSNGDLYNQLGHLFAEFLDKGMKIYQEQAPSSESHAPANGRHALLTTCITGAALGLPGTQRIFDDGNIERILRGEQFIGVIPENLQQAMVDKHITRVVKSADGSGSFETIDSTADVIKLAARGDALDLAAEFGYPKDRVPALDKVTKLAIAAGIDAMRDAGIPLVLQYKTTTTGSKLPDRWMLPEALRDDTGIIMASAFPGYNSYASEMKRHYLDLARRERLHDLENLRQTLASHNGHANGALTELDHRIAALRQEIEQNPYHFERRFLLRVLSMGHSQFAEYIGARGPNTQINSACASTTLAVALADDWIQARRCRRVIIVSADDVTSDDTMDWFGAGFLASGAAATDGRVEEAAIPFDRRRHGLIVGMGGAALVVESVEATHERGLQPVCEILGTAIANSAFHATRLDVGHICQLMEGMISQAELRWGIDRHEIAPKMVFVSHETYTPARGGSASAEINALRQVFGASADQIVIANTKGFTGHAMATGIEDVVAIKTLETGIVPPVANFKEVDPELGVLNLSKGGSYPVQYALRLGAGFGSQISMSLVRWTPMPDGQRRSPRTLGFDYRIYDRNQWNKWVNDVSGYPTAEIEVDHRTLRVKDQGPASKIQAKAKAEAKAVSSPLEAGPRGMSAHAHSQATTDAKAAVISVTPAKPAPAIATAPAVPIDGVAQKVLQIISEKTGYPPDMLNMDLDLEADLGIDTVKQAEMFAAIRAEYDIARDDNLQLRDFPTLKHTIQFVYDKRPDLKPAKIAEPVKPVVTARTVAAPTAPIGGSDGSDPVRQKVMAIIAEKTGYPPEMLDLDLDLEADLGIDTVKQAEMFAAIRAEYDIARDDNLQLRDFPTLKHTIQFVYDKRPDLKPAEIAEPVQPAVTAPTVAAPATPTAAIESVDPVCQKVMAIISEKTGYPPEMLDLELDLEADLGIDTVKQAEMFAAIRAEYDIPRDDNLQLRDFPTLKHTIQFVYDKRPDLKPPKIAEPVQPVVTAPTVAAPTAPIGGSDGSDPVRQKVMAIISEKTGYPPEMLDLELDLEADLGIDTVKHAEMFAAIRAEYDIPRDDNLQLRDFPTLKHTIQFVYDKRPDLKPAEIAEPVKPAVTAPTVAAPATPTAAIESSDPVRQKVMAIIAEKTGYPPEMLDLELDLEADLGIDTVKQAEMFAAIRAEYGIPRDDNLQLRDFPTLKHTIQFVYDRRPDLKAAPAVVAASTETATEITPVAVAVSTVGNMTEANKIPRRVPVAQLRPKLEFCKPTGVILNADSRVVVMSDHGGVGKALVSKLKKLGVQVLLVDDAPDVVQRLETWIADGAIQGVYWLPALDFEGNIAEIDLAQWREATRVRVKLLYATIRTLYNQIGGKGTFLVSATRLGGKHGYDDAGALQPMGGAVCGFTKTFKREKPESLVKVVDFGATDETRLKDESHLLIAETLSDPGAVEIGYCDEQRWTVGFLEQPVTECEHKVKLDKDTVFVITGAAGSIVSAITADLAVASGGTFHLLDLTPKPDASDPDLRKFVENKEELKRDIFQRLKDRGERATPVQVEKELAKLERLNAALSAIRCVEKVGGVAYYHCVNLLDADAMKKVMDDVRATSGRIDVLLHAGGLEISHLLPDKSPQEFDLVFDVKSDGWFNLLSNLGDMPLGAAVVFSSIAGRFGNGGQTDYSAANDLLCKYISNFKSTRSATSGHAIDWTAWGGIGMAARGSIPTVMKAAGIDMLPPEAGIPIVRRELIFGNANEEVVIAGSLGVMLKEFDETGGLAVDKLGDTGRIMTGQVSMGLYSGLTVETTLDPTQQPFLYDHQIGGTPVLPGVMGIEAMVEAAQLLYPDLHVAAVEQVAFIAPFKFYRHEPRTVTVRVTFPPERIGSADTQHPPESPLKGGLKSIVADCRLIGSRKLHGKSESEVTTHFTCKVILSPEPPAAATAKVPAGSKAKVKSEDIYKLYFHGPAYQVLDSVWKSGKKLVGKLTPKLPPNHVPAELQTLASPRLIELCFQTAGILEMGRDGKMGLPSQIDELIIHQKPSGEHPPSAERIRSGGKFTFKGGLGTLLALVEMDSENGFSAKVVDAKGNVILSFKGYKTMALPAKIDEGLLEPLKVVVKP